MIAARTNEGILELLLDSYPAAIAVFDCEMRHINCNNRWLADHHLELADVLGKPFYAVFPDTSEHWRDVHRRVLEGEVRRSDLEAFQRADGTADWIAWQMMPWRDDRGSIGGAILFSEVVGTPLSSRQWAHTIDCEHALLIDNAPGHAICLLDLEGRVAAWNAGAERIYGWTTQEITGKLHDTFFTEQDRRTGLPRALLMLAKTEPVRHLKSWRVRKDGTKFRVDSSLSLIRDESGKEIGFGAVIRDLTDDDLQHGNSQAYEAYIHSIVETVPDAMITIDERGIIEIFSAAAERLFKYTSEEVVGRNVSMLMPQPDADLHAGYLAHYLATGERRIIGKMRRVLGKRKDGSIFPHELYVGEALGGGRRVFIGFVRDLTTREERDAKLRDIQADLFRVSRVVTAGTLATALAHEINQPLTAIANYVQTASAIADEISGPHADIVRLALDEAGREALRAGEIIHRLRAFIQRGELERSIEPVSDIVADACALLSDRGGAQSRIICEIPDGLSSVLVDRVQIQQVLINLVRNSLDATGGKGRITISAQKHDSMIRITVEDDGPGIPAGKEHQVLEPFISSKPTGIGLGLAICRTIVEAHGGMLWCENAPEGGARFHFLLPAVEKAGD